jgi:hypothetical protein
MRFSVTYGTETFAVEGESLDSVAASYCTQQGSGLFPAGIRKAEDGNRLEVRLIVGAPFPIIVRADRVQ